MSVDIYNANSKHRILQLEMLQKIANGEWKVNEEIPSLSTLKVTYEGKYNYGIIRKTVDLLIEDDCLVAKNGTAIYVTPNAEVAIQNLIEQITTKMKKEIKILKDLNTLKGEVIKMVDEAFDGRM